jgi:hypothetical protein
MCIVVSINVCRCLADSFPPIAGKFLVDHTGKPCKRSSGDPFDLIDDIASLLKRKEADTAS